MRSVICLAAMLASASTSLAQQSTSQQPSTEEQQAAQQAQATKPSAQTVKMADLQRNAAQYIDKEITVEAEVQDVIGPRLLTVDDSEPFDLDGNLLVMIQAPFAGLVSEQARVTVTGTLKPLVRAEIDRELRWIDPNTASVSVEFERRPILVARSIKSSNGLELTTRVESGPEGAQESRGTSGSETGASGTSGTAASTRATSEAGAAAKTVAAPIEDASQLTGAVDGRLVGRDVNLSGVRVARAADKQSFWVTDATGRDNLLIVPVTPSSANVTEGQTVAIKGVVMQMPRAWQDKFSTTQGTDERIYVFASGVRAGR